jgi:hypothetical protein
MARFDYYDRMVRRMVVAGMAAVFGVGNAIACCLM